MAAAAFSSCWQPSTGQLLSWAVSKPCKPCIGPCSLGCELPGGSWQSACSREEFLEHFYPTAKQHICIPVWQMLAGSFLGTAAAAHSAVA
jgi:hypothetical protein